MNCYRPLDFMVENIMEGTKYAFNGYKLKSASFKEEGGVAFLLGTCEPLVSKILSVDWMVLGKKV